MEEEIKKALKAAGFDAVGLAPAEPLGDDGRRLMDWIGSGFMGEMQYLARNARTRSEPRSLLPGARSVIVAAAAYAPPERLQGPVAAYALYRDYHLALDDALLRGVEAIERLDGTARSRIVVDTSPLLERALARRAGLGWIGYSTNLITPSFGPFVLLGAIVTTLPLEPDEPLDGGACSECGRCIEACPTGALIEPYRLDARRCISYLTIEKKGPLDEGEAESLGGWAFGCDLCTAACMKDEEYQAPLGLLSPDAALRDQNLEGLLNLCEKGFKGTFQNTPLFRSGKSRLVRNILTAAGNRNLPWTKERAKPHLEGGTPASRKAARRALSYPDSSA